MINYLTSLVKPQRCSVSCNSSTEQKDPKVIYN